MQKNVVVSALVSLTYLFLASQRKEEEPTRRTFVASLGQLLTSLAEYVLLLSGGMCCLYWAHRSYRKHARWAAEAAMAVPISPPLETGGDVRLSSPPCAEKEEEEEPPHWGELQREGRGEEEEANDLVAEREEEAPAGIGGQEADGHVGSDDIDHGGDDDPWRRAKEETERETETETEVSAAGIHLLRQDEESEVLANGRRDGDFEGDFGGEMRPAARRTRSSESSGRGQVRHEGPVGAGTPPPSPTMSFGDVLLPRRRPASAGDETFEEAAQVLLVAGGEAGPSFREARRKFESFDGSDASFRAPPRRQQQQQQKQQPPPRRVTPISSTGDSVTGELKSSCDLTTGGGSAGETTTASNGETPTNMPKRRLKKKLRMSEEKILLQKIMKEQDKYLKRNPLLQDKPLIKLVIGRLIDAGVKL